LELASELVEVNAKVFVREKNCSNLATVLIHDYLFYKKER